MNRDFPFGFDLIHKLLRSGMAIIPLLFVATQLMAANGPDDKDKMNKRFSPPANSRMVDSGSKPEAPRFTPPPRQIPRNNAPKPERTIRNDPPRNQGFTSPSRNNPSNPPVVNKPSPSEIRNLDSVNRVMRNRNSGEGANPAALKNSPPQPTVSGALPPVNRNFNEANGNTRGRNSLPVGAQQPLGGSSNTRMNVGNDLQQRAQRDNRPTLSDIRNQLSEKKNDPPGNPINNHAIDNPVNKINDRPVNNNVIDRPANKPIDNPVNKINDRPVNNNVIDRPVHKPIDNPVNKINDKPVNNNIDRPVNKPIDNPVNKINDRPTNNKIIDRPINKPIDNPGNKIIDKPVNKPIDNPGKTNDKPINNNIDKPINKLLDNPANKTGDKKIDQGPLNRNPPLGGGFKKPDNGLSPNDKDKNLIPSDGKKQIDRGNRFPDKTDKTDKKDAFEPGRFPRDRAGKDKDNPSNSNSTKPGMRPNWDPSNKKIDDPKKTGLIDPSAGHLPPSAHKTDFEKPWKKPNQPRFDDRFKSGELDAVAKGDVAKQLKLGDQFKNMHKGDVARRMDLQKHVEHNVKLNTVNNITINNLHGLHPHHGFYSGMISPVYVNHCFKYHYYGPSFFAGECWYPHWNPWVVWSWGYHVHPMWDPRPLWCRPVIYQPYIVWNYWAPPAWQPLPEAECGTWVDVKPVVVEPEKFDLQLLAVRMVDPGHPDEKLGPRYRVWFRNNSTKPITDPFTVMLFASNVKQFAEDLPRGGVRVTSIEAGDTQSVDIRLPIDVYTMNRDAAGQPAPFEFLHFFVDANREVNDDNRENNGAVVPREEMLPVDPATFEIDPAQSHAGGEIIIAGEGLGPQPGQVLLHIDNREVQAEIVGWYDLGAKIVVPKMEIAAPTEAEIIVVRGDGAAANPLKVTLLPGEEGPTLEAPAEQ